MLFSLHSVCQEPGSFNLYCPKCHSIACFSVLKLGAKLVAGPLPLKSLHQRYTAICSACAARFSLDTKAGKRLDLGLPIYITKEMLSSEEECHVLF